MPETLSPCVEQHNETQQPWDPKAQFVRMELAHRHRRDRDALPLDPDFILTNSPLGHPSKKADGGRLFPKVQKALGLDTSPGDLVRAVTTFDPSVQDLEFLSTVVFDEAGDLARLLSTVDPARLPTLESKSITAILRPGSLRPEEQTALGDHIIQLAIQYVREREDFRRFEEMVREPRYYFFDRNVARAYETLYSPWILLFLYGFATQLVPRSAAHYRRWQATAATAMLTPRRNKVLSGPRFVARLSKLLEREHYLQSCIWTSTLGCRGGSKRRPRGSAKEQVRTMIRELWEVRRHLAGTSVHVHASTAELIRTAEVPRELVRTLARLQDRRLYERRENDAKVAALLDGSTQAAVEAWQQSKSDEVKKAIATALLSSPNIDQILLGQERRIRKSLLTGKGKKNRPAANAPSVKAVVPESALSGFIDTYWENAEVWFLEALGTWKVGKHGPFNAFFAKLQSNKTKVLSRKHPWPEDPIERLQGVSSGDDAEDDGRRLEYDIAKWPELLCRPFELVQAKREQEEQSQEVHEVVEDPDLTRTQRRVLRAYWEALRDVEDDEAARKLAVERLGMGAVDFRVHLSNARKVLKAKA